MKRKKISVGLVSIGVLLINCVLFADYYGAGQYTPTADTVMLWHANQDTGTSVTDSTINGYTGTLGSAVGDPTWTTNGRFGDGLTFTSNGSGNPSELTNLRISTLPSLHTFTLDFWVKPSSLPATGTMQYLVSNDSADYLFLRLTEEGKIEFGILHNYWHTVSSSDVITTDNWHQVAAIFDASRSVMMLYIDNVKQAEMGTYYISDVGSNWVFGGGTPWDLDDGSGMYSGLMDEIRISDVVITDFSVPEPATMTLLAIGMGSLMLRRKGKL